MSEYAGNAILRRVDTINALRIDPEHKLALLERVHNAVKAFRRGLITEEELLFIAA